MVKRKRIYHVPLFRSFASSRQIDVTFQNYDRKGNDITVKANIGESVLECAWEHKIDTLEGACDHCMSCSTCHVYVDESFVGKLAPPDEEELDMLDLAHEPKENSRLACQILASPSLDGIVVKVPDGVSNKLLDMM